MPNSTGRDGGPPGARRRSRRPRRRAAPAAYDPARFTDERLAPALGFLLSRDHLAALAGRMGVRADRRLSRLPIDDLIVAITERLAEAPETFREVAATMDRQAAEALKRVAGVRPDEYVAWLASQAASRDALGGAMWAALSKGGDAGAAAVDAQIAALVAGAPDQEREAPPPAGDDGRLAALERAVRELRAAVLAVGDRLEEREFRIAAELRAIRAAVDALAPRAVSRPAPRTVSRAAPRTVSRAANVEEPAQAPAEVVEPVKKAGRRRRRRRKAAQGVAPR